MADELEVVWNGASWREVQQPEPEPEAPMVFTERELVKRSRAAYAREWRKAHPEYYKKPARADQPVSRVSVVLAAIRSRDGITMDQLRGFVPNVSDKQIRSAIYTLLSKKLIYSDSTNGFPFRYHANPS